MNLIVNDYPFWLLNAHEPPCLSLYQPTHRHHPKNQQDPIRFRNLVKAMGESLRQKYPARGVQALLKPFRALVGDRDFWNHTLDGLAVLGADELARVAQAVVASRVATLLIEADRQVPGRMEAATGRIEFDDLANPEVDDLLDDLGELVLKMRGQVVVVPAERMPTGTGIAAIYR